MMSNPTCEGGLRLADVEGFGRGRSTGTRRPSRLPAPCPGPERYLRKISLGYSLSSS